MKLQSVPDLHRALIVPLTPCPTALGTNKGASALSCLFLLTVFGWVLAQCGSTLLILLSGLLVICSTASLLLSNDYCYTLRVECGRMFLLRNGVPILDTSVLSGSEEERRLLLTGQRIEAVRCRGKGMTNPLFGIPALQLGPTDQALLQVRLDAEVSALETIERQLELLGDPVVQGRVQSRLRLAAPDRPTGLHAELLRVAQGRSSQAKAAQDLLRGP